MSLDRKKTPFDEAFYLRKYPDVVQSLVKQEFPDAWSHYIAVGYDEKREICAFDEGWYISNYPDIRKAITSGGISNPFQHFVRYGFSEGRTPLPGSRAKRVFAYGSFGSNNVGDEAILEGVKRLYPDCIQIYHNKRRTGPGYQPHIILGTPGFFRADDYLILGGGGLLYNRETVVLMIQLARAALAAGATVDICRLGCEAARTEYRDEIKELFSLARRTSVRSTYSQEIISNMTGIVPEVQDDFAFLLEDEVRANPRSLMGQLTIGVVTASIRQADLRQLASALRAYNRDGVKDPIRFVHIPHSHSYFDVQNNDCITGEMLWSLMELEKAPSEDFFQIQPFECEPLTTLAHYRQLDGVITSRYHGLIFGHLAEIPTLLLGSELIKLRSFLTDHPSKDLFVAENFDGVSQALSLLVEQAKHYRQMWR